MHSESSLRLTHITHLNSRGLERKCFDNESPQSLSLSFSSKTTFYVYFIERKSQRSLTTLSAYHHHVLILILCCVLNICKFSLQL